MNTIPKKSAQTFDCACVPGLLQTVIDGLSAHIAVVDRHGVIVAVNVAWRRFADDNGSRLPNHGIGLNYISLSSSADDLDPNDLETLTGDDLGKAAAVGMLRVLRGVQDEFQLTYPCHAPDQKRWFLLTVTPTPLDGARGLIVAHENVTTLVQRQEDYAAALVGTVTAIAEIAEVRDPYTAGHQKAVSALATRIARSMNLDHETCKAIELAAIVHDIGKIALPAEILSRPGRISTEELMLIRTHSQRGHDMLERIPFPWPLATIVQQHHERIDGSGYPRGLKAGDICIEARVIGVADVVDAIASHRPYRPARGIGPANEEIRNGAGTRYDERVVEAYFAEQVQAYVRSVYGL